MLWKYQSRQKLQEFVAQLWVQLGNLPAILHLAIWYIQLRRVKVLLILLFSKWLFDKQTGYGPALLVINWLKNTGPQ